MPKVKNKMTFDVVTIGAKKDVSEAAQLMLEEKKGALPVTEDGDLVGILTDRDIISQVAKREDYGGKSVRDLMTEKLVTIGPEQDLDEARQLMADHQLDRILVTYGDRLLGIISETDIRAYAGRDVREPPASGTYTLPA
ncbi:MAG TPA: CBS domain-containing protein [Rubrobacter sp.]|nr:CBS domain-containing protein [Rubrobacter sp.]